jgi:epoxide hydrolase
MWAPTPASNPPSTQLPPEVAVFADDFRSIRTFSERDNSNIVHWSEFPDGGHFASMERPDVLTTDIRAFFAGRRAA